MPFRKKFNWTKPKETTDDIRRSQIMLCSPEFLTVQNDFRTEEEILPGKKNASYDLMAVTRQQKVKKNS